LRYRLFVPKDKRKPENPRTPKKAQGCSKRSWDGQLKKWRRDLHLWDPDNKDAFKSLLASEIVENIVAANPELADIVRVVREKLDNPTATFDDDDDDSEQEHNQPHSPTLLCEQSEENVLSRNLSNSVEEKKSEPQFTRVARTLVF